MTYNAEKSKKKNISMVDDDSTFDDLVAASGEIKLLRETIIELRTEMERAENASEDKLHNTEIKYRDETAHLKNTVIKLRVLLEEKSAANE